MLVLGAPLLLFAGLAGALVPVALHLLRPRPPSRRPLPTARFLAPVSSQRVRLSRIEQPLLLVVRMLVPFLLGAALALPAWVPRMRGRAEVVLLDRAAGRESAAWARAVAAAAAASRAGGGGPAALVVFDTAARVYGRGALTSSFFDRLGREGGSARSDYAVAFLALPRALAAAGADSARLTLVSPLASVSWSPGVAALRPALWPGRIRLERVGLALRGAPVPDTPVRRAAVWSGAPERFLQAAAAAAGLPPEEAPERAGTLFVSRRTGPAEAARLLELVRGGATLVRDAHSLRGLPAAPGSETLLLRGGEYHGAVGRVHLRPGAGDRLLGAWSDGTPAAVARPLGRGCLVSFGAELETGELPLQPGYPALVGALAEGCAPPAVHPAEALDAGSVELLAGGGGGWVRARELGVVPPGRPLARWLLAAAWLAAAAEWLLSLRARRRA